MADEDLRELERRWRGTGAMEDEAAYLLGRVRAGDLSMERLELASWLGSDGATAAVAPDDLKLSAVVLASKRAPTPRKGSSTLSRKLGRYAHVWDSRLASTPEGSKRALVAIGWGAQSCLHKFDKTNTTPREVLEAAEDALIHPSEERAKALEEAIAALRLELGDPPPSQKRCSQLADALEVVKGAGMAIAEQVPLSPAESDGVDMGPVYWGLDGLQKALGSGYRGAERAVKLVIEELLPWALGQDDPVRTRVAKRGETET